MWDRLKGDRPRNCTEGVATWDEANVKMYASLVLLTSGSALGLVEEFEGDMDGVAAFKKLEEKYEQKTRARKTALHQELLTCTLEPGEDPDDYFVRLERLQRLLAQMGLKIGDDHLPGIILSRLPSEYDQLRTVLEAMDDLAYDHVKDKLRTFYLRGAARLREELGEKAMVVRDRESKGCWHCGDESHFKRDCPKRKDKAQGDSRNREQVNTATERERNWIL